MAHEHTLDRCMAHMRSLPHSQPQLGFSGGDGCSRSAACMLAEAGLKLCSHATYPGEFYTSLLDHCRC